MIGASDPSPPDVEGGPGEEGHSISIEIGGIAISITSRDPALRLGVDGVNELFLAQGSAPDIQLQAGWDEPSPGRRGEMLFDSGRLWQLYRDDGAYRFQFTSPSLGAVPYKVATFSGDFTSGEISLRRAVLSGRPVLYPLEYPLDELLVTNFLAQGRGVEVHACGLTTPEGEGYLFVGPSGAGKTTMARLWLSREEVTVLSDDRIILRKDGEKVWMFGTPWHGEARLSAPVRSELKRVFFLRHGTRNHVSRRGTAEVVARFFASCFPPFHSPPGIEFSLGFYEEVSMGVPCLELEFVPDAKVVDFIRRS